MNKTKICMAVLATAGMGWGTPAMADPVMGFDPCGGGAGAGCGFVYASTWTDRTDSGVDVGVIAAGTTHTFSTQTVVTAFTSNTGDTTPLGLNAVGANQTLLQTLGIVTFELSKTITLNDFLFSLTGGGGAPVTINFTNTAQTVSPNLTIYFDPIDDVTDPSQAIRQGPLGAACYGGGPTACPSDGIAILTANVISNSSEFTADSPGSGNGSFTLIFEIDFFNPLYLDLSNLAVNGGTGGFIFSETMTGTLIQPFSGYSPPPVQMWDGTTVAGTDHNLFKVDSSESWGAAVVPEPGSLFLLGLGLAGLGAISRRRKI